MAPQLNDLHAMQSVEFFRLEHIDSLKYGGRCGVAG